MPVSFCVDIPTRGGVPGLTLFRGIAGRAQKSFSKECYGVWEKFFALVDIVRYEKEQIRLGIYHPNLVRVDNS